MDVDTVRGCSGGIVTNGKNFVGINSAKVSSKVKNSSY